MQALDEWFHSPLGQTLYRAERAVVQASVGSAFGRHGLQITASRAARGLLHRSSVRHPVELTVSGCGNDVALLGGGFRTRADDLALATTSIDVAVVYHALEVLPQPEALLAELERCLVAGAQLVIVGFSPYGLWGLYRALYGGKAHAGPWQGRFLSAGRLKRWLERLGLHPEHQRGVFYRPPLDNGPLLERLAFLERVGPHVAQGAGASYVLLARKLRAPLIPTGRLPERWRQPVLPGVPEPTARAARERLRPAPGGRGLSNG